jgi:hypothetical protein
MGTEIEGTEPNFFELYAQSISRANFIGDLLTFSKYGDYLAGRDKVQIPLGTRVVVHVPTTMAGYIKWEDNHPVDYRMGLIADGFTPPKRAELGDHDKSLWDSFDSGEIKDPWQFTNQVVMTNPKTGEIYTFATSSKTGLSAYGEVSKKYGQHIRQAPDDYPIFELQRSSYRHPRYGEQRIPVFKFVEWVDRAPHVALLNSGASEQPAPTTKSVAGTKAPAAATAKTTPRAKAPVKM